MNQEELSSLSWRLNLPVATLQKLPFHQISSLEKLLTINYYFFKSHISHDKLINYEKLTHIMQVEGMIRPTLTLLLAYLLIHLFNRYTSCWYY